MTKSILVEDNTDMIEMYADILQSNGHIADTAKDSQEGITKFRM